MRSMSMRWGVCLVGAAVALLVFSFSGGAGRSRLRRSDEKIYPQQQERQERLQQGGFPAEIVTRKSNESRPDRLWPLEESESTKTRRRRTEKAVRSTTGEPQTQETRSQTVQQTHKLQSSSGENVRRLVVRDASLKCAYEFLYPGEDLEGYGGQNEQNEPVFSSSARGYRWDLCWRPVDFGSAVSGTEFLRQQKRPETTRQRKGFGGRARDDGFTGLTKSALEQGDEEHEQGQDGSDAASGDGDGVRAQRREGTARVGEDAGRCSVDDVFRVISEGPSITAPPVALLFPQKNRGDSKAGLGFEILNLPARDAQEVLSHPPRPVIAAVLAANNSASAPEFAFCAVVRFEQPGEHKVGLYLQHFRGAWKRRRPKMLATDHNTTTWEAVVPEFSSSEIRFTTVVDVPASVVAPLPSPKFWEELPTCGGARGGYSEEGRWVKSDSPLFRTLGRAPHNVSLYPPPSVRPLVWSAPLLDGKRMDYVWLPYNCSMRWIPREELQSCVRDTGSITVIGTSRERTTFYALLSFLLKAGLEAVDGAKVHSDIPDTANLGARWNWWSPWRDSNNGGSALRGLDRLGLCTAANQSQRGRGIVFITLQEHNTNLYYCRDPSMEYGWRPVVNSTNALFPLGHRGAHGQDCAGKMHTNYSSDRDPTCLHEFQAILESCAVPGHSMNNLVWMSPMATQELHGMGMDWNDPATVTRARFTRAELARYSGAIRGAGHIPTIDALVISRAAHFGSNDGSHYYIGGTVKPNSVAATVGQVMAHTVCRFAEVIRKEERAT